METWAELVPAVTRQEDWLTQFHEGRRAVLEALYRDHFETVDRAVGRALRGADRETVVHEVFFRLLSRAELRENFQGGSLEAWLRTLARNQALDYLRRRERERPSGLVEFADHAVEGAAEAEERRLLIKQFCHELPSKWRPVFEARFVDQLPQREAAQKLGMRRTTLAYQELCIRRLLVRFARKTEERA